MSEKKSLYDFVREEALPTIWCPGCGYGIIVKATQQAMANLSLNKDDVMAVCGIGCSSRAASYCDVNSLQTTHGRAIAFATGSKMMRSDMHHILMLGDGDCLAIGGNHFLHAAKRNIDLTVIVMNNWIYAMTGGQLSPTTPVGKITTTSTLGNIEQPLDVCSVAKAAGATYIARTSAFHYTHMVSMIEKAIEHKGFSVVECLSPCYTGYGRRNKYKDILEMYHELQEKCTPFGKGGDDKFQIGILHEKERPEFTMSYDRMSKNAAIKSNVAYLPVEKKSERIQKRCEIRLTGSGGQGLITGGIMLAEAGIRQGSNCVQTQTYGPESRGGASCAEVVFADEEVDFPEVIAPDILLAMTQMAYDKYKDTVKPDGIVLMDSTYVHEADRMNGKLYSYPITQAAIETLGSAVYANVIAVGMIAGLTGLVREDVLTTSVLARTPKKSAQLNEKAVKLGFEIAQSL